MAKDKEQKYTRLSASRIKVSGLKDKINNIYPRTNSQTSLLRWKKISRCKDQTSSKNSQKGDIHTRLKFVTKHAESPDTAKINIPRAQS